MLGYYPYYFNSFRPYYPYGYYYHRPYYGYCGYPYPYRYWGY